MTGPGSNDELISRLEGEIRKLKESLDLEIRKREEAHRLELSGLENQHRMREEQLLGRLKEYETAFYKELNAQLKIYKQSWTWKIGRIFVGPADALLKIFRRNKKAVSEKTTSLKDRAPEALPLKPGPDIAVIFDTFTQSCFSPEFSTVTFTPENWKKVLESVPVDALIVESAWRGFGDTWQDRISHISGKNQSELFRLLDWTRKNKIPSVFWNKEDPVHFEQFIGAASRFDYIFTTDADCIPEYRKHAPGAVVQALPFAAQPGIHNPILDEPRSKAVCFAGTYYNERYHERKADMDFLLKPSLESGLDIFDRHFGDTSKVAGNFKFPDIYQVAIRGKLDYSEMVRAYKQYRVFLNVNSVKYSPTMFARRVFEILASGTPVISTFSQGMINLLGEGTVFISESEADTRKHLDYLLGNEHNWWKASLKGLRKVMKEHTYHDRAEFIFDTIGLETKAVKQVTFSVASQVAAVEEVIFLEKMLRAQTYSRFDVILVISGDNFAMEKHAEIFKMFEPFNVKLIKEDSNSLGTELLAASDSEYLALFHAGKYYGPNYLEDYALAVKYANPGIMGKKSIYRLEDNRLVISDKGYEYRYVDKIVNSTSVHRKNSIDPHRVRDYLGAGCVKTEKPVIFSIDPFNFLDSAYPLNKEGPTDQFLHEINI